jgi:RNA polymerase sigma factor (TIGR02999 family)
MTRLWLAVEVSQMGDGTDKLDDLINASSGQAEAMLPLVYEELRRLAARQLALEPSGHTLQPTALVHEAYLRIVGGGATHWKSAGHFFAAAAESMRRILIEIARKKRSLKGGGAMQRGELGAAAQRPAMPAEDLLALDQALAEFAEHEPVKAELVKLRFFAGLTEEQAAGILGISRATASRHWTYARAWLYECLARDSEIS